MNNLEGGANRVELVTAGSAVMSNQSAFTATGIVPVESAFAAAKIAGASGDC